MIGQLLVRTFRLSRPQIARKSVEEVKPFFRWHWISILLLGIIGNTTINLLFDLKYQRPLLSFSAEEYYNALIVSVILMTGTRFITMRLNSTLPRKGHEQKRLLIQSALHSIFIIVVVNVLVVGITSIFYGSSYAFEDLLLINAVMAPLAFFFSNIFQEKSVLEKPSIWRVIRWSWVSILLLGISSNTLINIILDYKYQRALVSLSLEEYFNAIVASTILLGGARWISKKLDSKFPWNNNAVKRLGIQLSLHFVYIVVALNILLVSITFIFYGGFYEFGDLMVINLSVVSLTYFFSLIDTGVYFFKNWTYVSKKSRAVANNGDNKLQISMGKSQYLIKQENIQCAVSQSRLVVIMTKDQRRLPYSQSLDALMTNLDPINFFRANRQTVLSHSIIQSIKPLDYGKIEVTLIPMNGHPNTVIISRTKAAEFRKWLKRQTV